MLPDEDRARLIDFLRGISSIAVALFHFNEGHPALFDLYHRAAKWGWLGVPVFFVVSGFCIASATARKDGGVATFWFRRMARIFPPYWASLLVMFGVVALRLATFGLNDVTVLPKDGVGWLYTLLALPSPASSVPGLNWVYWSLTYELAFYVLMGVAFLPFGRLCLVVISVAGFFLPGYPFDQWCLFGLGVGCYHLNKTRDIMTAAILAVCFVQTCWLQRAPVAAVGIATAAMLLFPSHFRWLAAISALRRVGDFSYSLYLIHVPVGCFLLHRYLPWQFSRDSLCSSIARDCTLLALTMAFAYGFYRLAEKPVHEFARNTRLSRKQTSRA